MDTILTDKNVYMKPIPRALHKIEFKHGFKFYKVEFYSITTK